MPALPPITFSISDVRPAAPRAATVSCRSWQIVTMTREWEIITTSVPSNSRRPRAGRSCPKLASCCGSLERMSYRDERRSRASVDSQPRHRYVAADGIGD